MKIADARRIEKFNLPLLVVAAIATVSTFSCSSVYGERGSFFHGTAVPEGSHRLVEVSLMATRDQIVGEPFVYESLKLHRVTDSQITDGSVAGGRVFCCGGPHEKTPVLFYVPSSVKIEMGDIVEIRSGPKVLEGDLPQAPPNVAVQVREGRSTPYRQCRWMPENDALWLRVIYCEWMPKEGWIQQAKPYHVWIKTVSG
jgi:hypothetical protein